MTKTYKAINHVRLITDVMVGNMCGVIEFRGGKLTPTFTTGTFTTSNPALQEAIESDPRYGKEFILVCFDNVNPTLKKRTNDKRRNKREDILPN